MKAKKLLSVILSAALLLSVVMIPSAFSVSAEEAAFKSQHTVVDFSSYNIVDYATNSTGNNVYMNTNGPSFSIQQETVGEEENSYLQVTKTAKQTANWEPHHSIIINPTGSTAWDGHYRVQQNGKYRLTFKYKLTKEGTDSYVYLRARACSDYNLKSNFNTFDGSAELGSTYLEPTETWTEKTVEFNGVDTIKWSISSLAFFISTGGVYNFGYTLSIDDVTIDRLGSVTLNYQDGTTKELWGVPKATSADKYNSACSAFEGEAIELEASSEVYSYTTDESDATAVATNMEYYGDADYTTAIPTVFPASNGLNIYAKATVASNISYQMAFTGFEDGVYSSRKPADYFSNDDVKWYYLPDSLFRTDAGLSTSDEAFTGSNSIKYTAKAQKSNYRAIYIGNGFEFSPNRTYSVSFYVKAGENNTAKTIVLGIRGGIGNGQWSVQNNTETKTVDLTKSDWQKITILYTPNEVTETSNANVTSVNAYYVPQLFMDYVNTDGACTEGAELYLDSVSIEVIAGDTNGDGLIDIRDLVRAKKMAISTEAYSTEDIKAANLDTAAEGVQANDLTKLRKLLLEGAEEDNSPVPETLTDRNGEGVDLSNYGYVWGDEFEGTSLDYLKWGTSATLTGYSDIENSEENISVSDGVLTMATTYDNGVYITSNDIQTEGTMNFKYGYIEYRAKVPFVDGAWATFWTKSNAWMHPETFTSSLTQSTNDEWYNADYNSEIDLLELKNGSEGFTTNLHNFANDTDYQVKNGVIYSLASDFDANAWHTYGYLWTESELVMFVDGKEFGRYSLNDKSLLGNNDMSGFDDWMTLHLSNKIYSPDYCASNSWASALEVKDSSQNFDLQIDYVRVYQSRNSDTMIHIKK